MMNNLPFQEALPDRSMPKTAAAWHF